MLAAISSYLSGLSWRPQIEPMTEQDAAVQTAGKRKVIAAEPLAPWAGRTIVQPLDSALSGDGGAGNVQPPIDQNLRVPTPSLGKVAGIDSPLGWTDQWQKNYGMHTPLSGAILDKQRETLNNNSGPGMQPDYSGVNAPARAASQFADPTSDDAQVAVDFAKYFGGK